MQDKSNLDNFVTIKTFTGISDLAIPRTLLEANGLECRVLDELTVQVSPLYSNAIGGIKLQVRESDIQKAAEILKDGGFVTDEDLKPVNDLAKLYNRTSQLPLLKNLRPELRLIIIASIVASAIVCILYFAMAPSTYEQLTKSPWCVGQITYKGELFTPSDPESQIQFIISGGGCEETLWLYKDGKISLPGEFYYGFWELDGGSLRISQTEKYNHIYDGVYDINLSGNKLVLKSKQTTIYCYPLY